MYTNAPSCGSMCWETKQTGKLNWNHKKKGYKSYISTEMHVQLHMVEMQAKKKAHR